jgi:hypothetical protein
MALYVLLSFKNYTVELWHGTMCVATSAPMVGVMPQPNDKGRE